MHFQLICQVGVVKAVADAKNKLVRRPGQYVSKPIKDYYENF